MEMEFSDVISMGFLCEPVIGSYRRHRNRFEWRYLIVSALFESWVGSMLRYRWNVFKFGFSE